jgi:hypothetical protein
MQGKLTAKQDLSKQKPRRILVAPLSRPAEKCHAKDMENTEFHRLLREAEDKLARGRGLSRTEQLVMLAALLMGQATRKEKRYGQD